MISGAILDAIFVFFAVFGVYSLVRLVITAVFYPPENGVFILLTTAEDAANAEYFVARAREQFFFRGNGKIAALVSPLLAGDRDLIAFLKEEDIAVYFIRTGGGE